MSLCKKYGFSGNDFKIVVDNEDYPSPGIALRHLETNEIVYSDDFNTELKNYEDALKKLNLVLMFA